MAFALTHRPSPGNLNTPFGPRPKPTPTSPGIHYGQDYGWGNGRTIYAARAGTVKSYGDAGAYGRRLVIDHGTIAGARWETWYCHTERAELGIRVGGKVAGGQAVAQQGATGNVRGMHLHFELRANGYAVDPAPYFAVTAPAGTDIDRLDWYDMADKADLKAALREVLAEGLIDSPITGNDVSVTTVLEKLHGNVGDRATLEGIIREIALPNINIELWRAIVRIYRWLESDHATLGRIEEHVLGEQQPQPADAPPQ